ncbi:hypothetical protein [Nitrosomonas ureae]|uniref:hypothetical protein n=1 Tax=Nitrosomonas ureae TaxID=44577 RepID=UPI001E469EDD|nr:hypothetical protein [Nitrosomonas ureae]
MLNGEPVAASAFVSGSGATVAISRHFAHAAAAATAGEKIRKQVFWALLGPELRFLIQRFLAYLDLLPEFFIDNA